MIPLLKRYISSAPILLVAFTLSGCINLTGTRNPYPKNTSQITANNATATVSGKNNRAKRGEVHTMLGGLGIFSTGMYQLRDSVADRYEIPARSTIWYNAGDVSRTIISNYYSEKQHKPIILMGHSLGANEQIKVARNLDAAGVPVELLVIVDAVSQTIVPANVKHVYNLYKPGYVPMLSGLRLKAVDPTKTHIENINVATLKGIDVNHFTIDKNKKLQAMILNEVGKVLSNDNKKTA